MQLLLVRPQQGDIVHVAGHVLHTRQRHDVPVQRLQIEVRQPLADVIANGQPAAAGLNDGVDRPQETLVLDLPGQRPNQAPAGDAGIILRDIQLCGIFRSLGVVAKCAADFLVDSLPAAPGNGCAGPRVHSTHEHRLHDRYHHPLDHAVRPKRDHLDFAELLAALIVDFAHPWLRRNKALCCNDLIGLFDVPVQIRQYAGNILPALASFGCFQNNSTNEVPVNHLVIEIANPFRHRIFLRPCLPARSFEPWPTKPRPMRQYFHQAVRKSLRQSEKKQVVARRRWSSSSTRCCSR